MAYALAQEDFSRAVAARAMRSHEQQDMVDMTLVLLMEAQKRASRGEPLEQSASQAMSMGIALYAGLTKTLRQANDLTKGGQFLTLAYGSQENGTLRPLAVLQARPLSVQEMLDTCQIVMAHDRQHHPEWFTKKKSSR